MNRRTLCSTICVTLIGASGCLTDERTPTTVEPATGSSDSRSPTTTGAPGTRSSARDDSQRSDGFPYGTDCPARGVLWVSLPETDPATETVLDAANDGLLENEHLAAALRQAADAHAESRNENRQDGSELARVSNEAMLSTSDEIEAKIGYAERTYVEYRGVTYSMEFLVMEC